MTQQTHFGLSAGHYAQPRHDTTGALINGQNLVDAFAECDMAFCDKLAAVLAQGGYEKFGRMMEQVMLDWAA